MIKQCESGHFYDADRFPVCPYCGSKDKGAQNDSDDDATMPLVRPTPPQSSPMMSSPFPAPAADPDDDDDATIPLAFYNKPAARSVLPPMEKPAAEEQPPVPVMPPMEQPPMSVIPPMEQPDVEEQPIEQTLEPAMPVMPPMEQPVFEQQPPVMPPIEETIVEQQSPMPVMPPMEQPPVMPPIEETIVEQQPPVPVMPPMEQPPVMPPMEQAQPPVPVMPPMEQPPVMPPMEQAQPPMPVMPPMEQPPMQPVPPMAPPPPPAQQYQPRLDFPYPPLIPMQQPAPQYQPQPMPPAPPVAPPPPPMPPAGGFYGFAPDDAAADEPTISIAQAKSGNEPVVGWLLGLTGNTTGQAFELKAGKNFIGKAPSNDVCIPDDEAMGLTRHAAVLYEPRERVFIALPSEGKELLYLNGELLVKSAQLKAYDRLKAGNTELLFFPLCTEKFAWEDLEEDN